MACSLSASRLRPSHTPQVGSTAHVRVPASTANLGPGFDSIGMALDVWDDARAEVTDGGLVVDARGSGAGEVPLDGSHLVVRSMGAAWEALDVAPPAGLELRYTGAVPHSRGLGSSATAIVAGVALATALAGHDLDDAATLAFVNDVASSIEGHPDNASASVYGSVTVSWADVLEGPDAPRDWHTAVLRPHPDVVPVVIVPAQRLSTATARAALPESVPLAVAARNSGRAALLAHAITTEPSLLMPATLDALHQEQRRSAYPDSMALVDALRDAGVPAVISGAGPTVLALASRFALSAVHDVAGGGEVLELSVPTRGITPMSR